MSKIGENKQKDKRLLLEKYRNKNALLKKNREGWLLQIIKAQTYHHSQNLMSRANKNDGISLAL